MLEVTGSEAARITELADKAMERAESIAKSDRLTPKAKQEDIEALTKEALGEIEEYAAPYIKELEELIGALEVQTDPRDYIPTAEEIGQVNYLRDVLAKRWESMPAKEALADWERAILADDRITARVYRDFYPDVWKHQQADSMRAEFPHVDARKIKQPANITALELLTDEMLLTDEQKEKRDHVRKWRKWENDLKGALTLARVTLSGATYSTRERRLVDGRKSQLKPMNF